MSARPVTARLLLALDEAMRAELLAAGTEKRYSPGQAIHRHGDHERSLQIILSGEVGFSRLDTEGRQVRLGVMGPGESFGEISLLTGRPRTHDAVAIGKVRLLTVSLPRFQNLLTRFPGFRDYLLAELAEQLVQVTDILDSAMRMSIPQRVAQYLVVHAEGAEQGRLSGLRQSDIAEALNVTRESVAAALRGFREAGMIETRYREISIIDLQGLRGAMDST